MKNSKELLIEFMENFEEYLVEWSALDRKRHHWLFRTILYIPVGFFLEMRVLHMKHKLTKEFSEYREKYEELVLESKRLCSERN